MDQNEINEEIREKIKDAIQAIQNTENVVSVNCTHTYNFKGRKSAEIAARIMGKLAEKNAVVCDPFFGSNAFGLAAALNGLKFIGSELDNYTYDVTRVLYTKIDRSVFAKYYRQIKDTCRSPVMELYATQCCGVKNYISKLHFDPEGENGFDCPEYYHPTPHRDIENDETIVLAAQCPVCNKKRKAFQKADEERINACKNLDVSEFPAHRLMRNSRINITASTGADRYDRNFTHRAKYALLLLQRAILKLPSSIERDVLEHCLVASLTLARIGQYGSGSEYIYQVMRKQAQEKNVWEIFESKVDAFLKFKDAYAVAQCADVTDAAGKMYLVNADYSEFLKQFTGAADLVYTDPPYTDQVAYLERSQLYRDWLNRFYYKGAFALREDMLEKEIVVTNAPSRFEKSGLIQYGRDLDKMFGAFCRALKPNGLVVMHIKLGAKKYISVFAEYVKFARKNGFEIVEKYCIDKKDPTLRKQAARKNTLANEIIVFFQKLDPYHAYWYEGDTDVGFYATKFLYGEIKQSETGYLSLTESVALIEKYLKRNFRIESDPSVVSNIERTVRNNFLVMANSLVCMNPGKLYLDVEDNASLFTKLYDMIPVVIRGFSRIYGFTLEDLYSELIFRLFNGNSATLTQLVESKDNEAQIISLLAQYCEMNDSEKYYFRTYKNPTDEREMIELSTLNGKEFEDLIKRLLQKKGYYNVWVIGKSGDRGVDIVAKKTVDGVEETFLFQCKRWLANVGGIPVQRLHSMMVQLKVSNAVCVTTSDYTADAKRESQGTGVRLINGKELLDELAVYFPGTYYMHGCETK